MGGRQPIPLDVITGFLGAGKTTLLNRLLGDPAMAGALVIINEFGAVGLDHLFIETRDETVVELSSGCLCCTIRGDFTRTLENVLRDLDNKRMPRLTRVVVETTGLADPAPILNAVMLHPYLSQRFAIDSVITVVDGVNAGATLDAHQEARRQAAFADRLVITKTELANPEALRALTVRLDRLNPRAPRLQASGQPGPDTLFGGGFRAGMDNADVRAFLGASAHEDHHEHGHGHGHEHGHQHEPHHHDHDPNRHGSITTFTLTHDRPLPERALEIFLDLTRARFGAAILRLKGLVDTGAPHPLAIHMVQGLVHPPVRLTTLEAKGTSIVIIGDGIERDQVERLFFAAASVPMIDTPDANALTDNPLAPPGLYGG